MTLDFRNPFLSFESEEILAKRLKAEFPLIPAPEIKAAVHDAWEELMQSRTDMHNKGEEVIKYLKENNKRGIVLAGRPYHIDPEINHGIPELINSYGIAVLLKTALPTLEMLKDHLLLWTSGCTTHVCMPQQAMSRLRIILILYSLIHSAVDLMQLLQMPLMIFLLSLAKYIQTIYYHWQELRSNIHTN